MLVPPCIPVLITLVAVSVCAAGVGAQAGMFSAGDEYEQFMGRWSRALAPLLIEFAGVRNGDSVLDVGSGTGALTAAVAAVAPASRVIGIDPAAPYVAFAQARYPGDLIRFEVGDAQQLRFADGSFDRTLSLLVINFIPDRAKALNELTRVTRPGGTVGAAVWDYGQGMEMLRVFWDEAISLNPAMDSRDERHMPLCRKGELAAFWREHGLQDVSEEALTIQTRFASFDDYWSPFLTKQGPAGTYVGALPERAREELRLRVRRRLLGDGPDRPIALAARAWAVRGIISQRAAAGEPFQNLDGFVNRSSAGSRIQRRSSPGRDMAVSVGATAAKTVSRSWRR
jgi:SAM-dependent methyltransferase